MIIITIRTDKPESELGIYNANQRVDYFIWQAHRQLAETIHQKLKELIEKNKLALQDIEGIIVYKGPGSFTGLRIGLSVANALADSLSLPIVSETGENWKNTGIQRITAGQNEKVVVPNYGSPPHITKPKH